jgi:hypothetical protein
MVGLFYSFWVMMIHNLRPKDITGQSCSSNSGQEAERENSCAGGFLLIPLLLHACTPPVGWFQSHSWLVFTPYSIISGNTLIDTYWFLVLTALILIFLWCWGSSPLRKYITIVLNLHLLCSVFYLFSFPSFRLKLPFCSSFLWCKHRLSILDFASLNF